MTVTVTATATVTAVSAESKQSAKQGFVQWLAPIWKDWPLSTLLSILQYLFLTRIWAKVEVWWARENYGGRAVVVAWWTTFVAITWFPLCYFFKYIVNSVLIKLGYR